MTTDLDDSFESDLCNACIDIRSCAPHCPAEIGRQLMVIALNKLGYWIDDHMSATIHFKGSYVGYEGFDLYMKKNGHCRTVEIFRGVPPERLKTRAKFHARSLDHPFGFIVAFEGNGTKVSREYA